MRFPKMFTFVQPFSDLPMANLHWAFLEMCSSYFIAAKNEKK